MKRQIFRVYYHEGNNPTPCWFLVNAVSAEQVRAALVNEYGEEEADGYEIDANPVRYAPAKRQMWVANGRFVWEEDAM